MAFGPWLWTLAEDPGLSGGRSCEVIRREGRILRASGRSTVCGAAVRMRANLLAVILVPPYWVSAK